MDYQLGPGPLQVDQNTIDEKIKSDIGIVENGDVATHAIPSGYYVIWKGDLYVAKTDISSGTTLSTSNLTVKPNGIGAEVAGLKGDVTTLNSNVANLFKWIYIAGMLGALAAGDRGCKAIQYTIPNGYKTTGTTSIALGHPGAAGGLTLNFGVSQGIAEGTRTGYISYYAPLTVAEDNSDYISYIQVIKSDYSFS